MIDVEITLRATVPDVVEIPVRIEVRCGETTCEVYEYGHRGSDNWAAWTPGAYVIGKGGKVGYTLNQALDDARQYVRTGEQRRLIQAQLKVALDDGEKTDA